MSGSGPPARRPASARRHPPSVYRRRRAVVGVLALAVVGGPTAWAVSAFAGDDADGGASSAAVGEGSAPATTQDPADGQPTDEASAEPAPDAPVEGDEEAAADGACPPEAVLVEVVPDASSYALGSTATFSLTITGAGAEPCSLDVGGSALELVVTSGSDRIWSSDDCQAEASSRPHELQPGEQLVSETPWPLERSAPGCTEGLPDVRPGTYVVTGRVGELTSAGTPFQVTG